MTPWSDDRIFLIAEAGVNHNGSVDRALAMVDLAADCGADAVKFQTFRAEALATADARMAAYQERNIGALSSQLEMLRALQLPPEAYYKLRKRAGERGIIFFSTAFDSQSVAFLERMGQPLWKVPSGEITNYPYLMSIAALGQPTILSTGMATLAEVEGAVEALEAAGLDRASLCILHCTTEYPAPPEEVNLRAMPLLGAAFGCAYGYSDHTLGTAVSTAAVALGAKVIEKHFTLDKALPGPDHRASLSPAELAEWARCIRIASQALGSSVKHPGTSEERNRAVARKYLVAARPIAAGDIFSEENLAVKRAGRGLSPMLWPQVLGTTARRAFVLDEPIEL